MVGFMKFTTTYLIILLNSIVFSAYGMLKDIQVECILLG